MERTIKTPGGTTLALIKLKGKDYLPVAQRILQFSNEVPNYTIDTQFLLLTDEQTIAQVTVTIFDKDKNVVKKAVSTKRESKKEFFDHTEKAETSALGRALANLGFGTQFATQDMDEGHRIVDSPIAPNFNVMNSIPVSRTETAEQLVVEDINTGQLVSTSNGGDVTTTLSSNNVVVSDVPVSRGFKRSRKAQEVKSAVVKESGDLF